MCFDELLSAMRCADFRVELKVGAADTALSY